MIAKVNNPEVSVEELGHLISADISLSHKVLKFINSPMSGLRTEVDSIQQAVVLLGLTTIKNWVTILALATGSNKPQALANTALVRARCCQMLATKSHLDKPESFFTVGLFSTLDALMDQPLDEILKNLPLSSEAKTALVKHTGVFGEALKCTLRLEMGEFDTVGFQTLEENELAQIYRQAIQWADELFASVE